MEATESTFVTWAIRKNIMLSSQAKNKVLAGAVAVITASGAVWGASLKMSQEEQEVSQTPYIYAQLISQAANTALIRYIESSKKPWCLAWRENKQFTARQGELGCETRDAWKADQGNWSTTGRESRACTTKRAISEAATIYTRIPIPKWQEKMKRHSILGSKSACNGDHPHATALGATLASWLPGHSYIFDSLLL